MFIMSCRQCAGKFEAKTERRMYCSQRCKDKGKPSASGLTCRVCGESMQKGATSGRTGEAAHTSGRRTTWEHGTRQGYKVHKCKCATCRAWNSDQFKSYKEKRREEGRPLRTTGGSGPWISPTLRESVFERDGWRCQLCGEVLDRDADPQSNWYPSLDHIIPQSQGGAHTFENLRATHRWCNCVRGDDRFHQDLFV